MRARASIRLACFAGTCQILVSFCLNILVLENSFKSGGGAFHRRLPRKCIVCIATASKSGQTGHNEPDAADISC